MPKLSFHVLNIKGKGKRTTIKVEERIAILLSLHLCKRFDLPTVREWLQGKIDEDPGAFYGGASQRLTALAAEEIAPKALQVAYRDLVVDTKVSRGRRSPLKVAVHRKSKKP